MQSIQVYNIKIRLLRSKRHPSSSIWSSSSGWQLSYLLCTKKKKKKHLEEAGEADLPIHSRATQHGQGMKRSKAAEAKERHSSRDVVWQNRMLDWDLDLCVYGQSFSYFGAAF